MRSQVRAIHFLAVFAIFVLLPFSAHAAQYMVYPSGANASNGASFSGSAATDLDTNDSDSSYASTSSSSNDLYMDLDNPVPPASTINWVSVTARVRDESSGSTSSTFLIGIKLGASTSTAGSYTSPDNYTAYTSSQWTTRPGGGAWTWADVDSLVAFVDKNQANSVKLRITELYITVDYTITENITGVSAAPNPLDPNPAANTTISYTLADYGVNPADLLWIRIYDGAGSIVRNLVTPGSYTAANKNSGLNNTDTWDGKNDSAVQVANGTYTYHIDAAAWMASKATTGTPYDIAAVKNAYDTLYAVTATSPYLYKSTNGGTSWSSISFGGTASTYAVVVSDNGQYIYTAVLGTGVRMSSNSGSSWSTKNPGNTNVIDVACSSTGAVVYALVNQTPGGAGTKKVYKSTNYGSTWKDITGITMSDPYGITCSPDGTTVMIIDPTTTPATSNANRFKSTDGGSTWSSSTITRGTAVGQVSYPYQISLDAEGGYFISERGNHRIQKFDSTGTAANITLGGTASGDGNYQFNAGTTSRFGIGHVEYDEQHILWIADVTNVKVKKYAISDFATTTDIVICDAPGCTDSSAPATISDLATGVVLQTAVELTWTAPGDDGAVGDIVAPGAYDIRYLTQPITTENWFSATQALSTPSPGGAGTPETFSVAGLNSNTTYYFAMKTKDDAGNWSGLSNVVSATTTGALTKLLAVYTSSSSASTQPKYKTWTGSGWSGEMTLPAVTASSAPRWLVARTNPTGQANERVAAVRDSSNKVYLYTWDGSNWTSWISGGIALYTTTTTYSVYDIAYENLSGRAVFLYSKSASYADLNYMIWDGTSWGAEQSFAVARTTGAIQWVRLEPKPGSDEMMAVWSDANADLSAAVWDPVSGTFTEKAAVMATTLTSTANQVWDVAYETQSGKCMIAYMDNNTTPKYYTYSASTWTGPSSASNVSFASTADNLRLVADPPSTSNKIVMGISNDGGNLLKAELWDGSAWNATVVTLTSSYSPNASNKRAFDLAWESKSGKVLAVYGKNTSKGQYRRWDGVTWASGNWAAEASLPTGATNPAWIQLRSDPGSNEIMAAITDSSTDINLHRWNGYQWQNRQEFSTNVSSTTGENFMLTYRIDALPTVSISNPGNDEILSGTTYTIAGSAWDDYGIDRVEVSIQRSGDSKYWTGAQWVASQTWLRAVNTLSWTHVWQLPPDNGTYTYTITARGTDNKNQIGAASTPVTGITVFTIPNDLTVYRNTAVVDSSTQITATAEFTGDGNGDSSTQFETGPAAGGPWTDQGSLATASPRVKAIPGLTAGTPYYIRITHTDPDGVNGTNPQVIGPYTTKTNATTVTAITANVDDCSQVTVSAYYSNDGDSNGTTAFHYSTDGEAWVAAPGCGAVAGASPRTCAVTGLTANTGYYFKATFTDAGGVNGTNPITTPLTNPSPYKTLATCQTKGTTVGTLSVDNTSCRQFTVRAGFTGDDNANGSTKVEFKKTADSTWGTACEAQTTGSPRTCQLSDVFGLTASTSYDLRVTWTDADGVTGTNPQTTTLSTPACGSTDIFPPTMTIYKPSDGMTVSGNATYPVRIETMAYDWHGLNTSSVKVIVDGTEYAAAANPYVSGNYYYDWTPATTGYHTIQSKATDNAGNVGYSPTFRVYVNSIATDSSGLFTGDGKLLVRDNTSQLCYDCHGGIRAHSSQNTSAKYGNWSFECRTCHQPHNTANIFLIKPSIRTPNSGFKSVDFRNQTGQADYSFATKSTPGNGPCEVCHTRTRNGDDSGRYRNTGTGPGPMGDSHFTGQACTDCHKHTRGFSAISAGGVSCGTCHPDRWNAMNAKSDEYHMYMQNSDTTEIADSAFTGSKKKYPSKSTFGSGDKESEHRRCLMCHADMDVFHPQNNPNSPGVAYNLRVSISVAPDAADPTTHTNTDFRADRADGGLCLSCHTNQQTKNTDKIRKDGTTNTPAWDVAKFAAGTHSFVVPTTFKSDNTTFNAVCAKCHTDTMIKDYQSSTYRVGNHSGTTRSYLSNINGNATLVETTKNSLEENMCFQCHSMSVDGPDNYNPNGWDGVAVGDGKDGYNVQTMKKKAQRIKYLFAMDSSHPIDGAPPYDSLNGLANAAGRHRVDEWLLDTITPSGVQIANWNPAASRHVECMDCHNPHFTNATLRDINSFDTSVLPNSKPNWHANPYHPAGTEFSGRQIIEGSFGGEIGGANWGTWGVSPTYSVGSGGVAPTSFTKLTYLDSTNMMYQICFKCHSIYAYGNTKPQIPWGTPTRLGSATGATWGGQTSSYFDWAPGFESDLSVDFNPYNYGFHPVVRRGRNQPAPHLNSSWPYFNGSGTMWKTSGTSTDTVTYTAATKRVVKSGGTWTFPTYYIQPGWKIQLNRSDASAPTDTTNKTDYWYEIKTVISTTELELVSGPATDQTNKVFSISAGLGWAFVPPYGPWSTLACGDCHQSGDAADPVGPHGSENPWILREINMSAKVDNNLDGDMNDAGDLVNGGTWTRTNVICYSCHRRDVYGAQSAGSNGEPALTGVSKETSYSRASDGHPPGGDNNPIDTTINANPFGIWCMVCHGGDSIGGIHGSNRAAAGGGASPIGLRLRNGSAVTGNNVSGATCYTKSSFDNFNMCDKGHGGDSYSTNYSYTTSD